MKGLKSFKLFSSSSVPPMPSAIEAKWSANISVTLIWFFTTFPSMFSSISWSDLMPLSLRNSLKVLKKFRGFLFRFFNFVFQYSFIANLLCFVAWFLVIHLYSQFEAVLYIFFSILSLGFPLRLYCIFPFCCHVKWSFPRAPNLFITDQNASTPYIMPAANLKSKDVYVVQNPSIKEGWPGKHYWLNYWLRENFIPA